MRRWWVLADADLREVLQSVDRGELSVDEAYALLLEESEGEDVE